MEELYKEINKYFNTCYQSNEDIDFEHLIHQLFKNYNEDILIKLTNYYLKNISKICYDMFSAISSCPQISEKYIGEYYKYLDWYKLLKYHNFSEKFLEHYINHIPSIALSIYQKLSESFIEKHKTKLYWLYICRYQKLSENFIEKHENHIDWREISAYQELSKNFIEKHKYDVNWTEISCFQKLSEKFIAKHKNDVQWCNICRYQKLSEKFILKYSDYMHWDYIFSFQKLSENFMKKYKQKFVYNNKDLTKFQKFSEKFAEENMQLINFKSICKYKKLSEEFIEKHWVRLDFHRLSKYQKLSEKIIEIFKHNVDKDLINDNWIYKPTEEKKQEVIETGKYDCYDDYFVGYKAIRTDRYSLYNFQYKYEKGGVYESWCDCSEDEDSFGLNVGTEKFAKYYGNIKNNHYIIVRCKVRYEDIGRIVHNGDKIRCFKIEILD